MTEKLYDVDSYIKEFCATVIFCTECERGYDIVLDRTAFFPEGGGQSSDKGFIDNAEIFDVQEVNGEVHHYSKTPVFVNKSVQCTINFDEKFEKMQCHTAEHIASGFFHSLYGIENVGFHLGYPIVTFDTSGEVSENMLREVERLANEAVFKNLPITVSFPSKEELSALEYRSKLELSQDVRIVTIEGVDSCACCAPHVASTGEVGIIKFIDCQRHRGGSRISMLAGRRAYEYLCSVFSAARGVGALLSAPITEIERETERALAARADSDYRLSLMGREAARAFAESLSFTEGSAVVCYPMLDTDALRTFVNIASEKVGGTLVALCGEEENYKYILYSASDDFQTIVKKANAALMGKGGGRAPMAQGSFCASLEAIKKFFAEN